MRAIQQRSAGIGRGLPIQARLTIVSAILMGVVISSLGSFLVLRLEADLEAALDDRLRDNAQIVGRIVDDSGSLDGVLLGDPGDAFAQVVDLQGRAVASTPGLSGSLLSPATIATLTDELFVDADVETAEEPVPARLLAIRHADGAIVVGASTEDQEDALSRLMGLLVVGGPLAVVLASGVGWLVAGAALRPVERLRIDADAISASEPDRRLAVPATDDELARLTVSLNGLLARLADAAERERRFVANASHELRTPLANLQAELDLALRRVRSRDELERVVRSAAEEVERLTRLAEDLLVLARAGGAAGLPIRRELVDVDQLVRQAVSGFAVRAAATGTELRARALRGGQATVDPARVRQALGNLIDNAIRHSPAGGIVDVVAAGNPEAVELTVSDSGPGFSADSPSASGLGLSIVRAVAEAHRGSVVLGSSSGGGASVTLRLPR